MQIPFFAGCSVIDRTGYHLQLQPRSTPNESFKTFAYSRNINVLLFSADINFAQGLTAA